MKKTQVLVESDGNGLTLLSVTLFSIFKSANPARPLIVYIAHDTSFVQQKGLEKLRKIAARFPFVTLCFANFDPLYAQHQAILNPQNCRWPPMVWAWIFFPLLFPTLSGNLVKLDLDVLINADLGCLCDLNLAEQHEVIAAVPEQRWRKLNHLRALSSTISEPFYINNGVMVVNADAYIAENFVQQALRWYAENHAVAAFLEQDIINVLTIGRKRYLSPQWNYNDALLRQVKSIDLTQELWHGIFRPAEILAAMLNAYAYHYHGTKKPHRFNHRPERNRYRRLMRELGLIRWLLPGENPFRLFEGLLFDLKHAYLKRKAHQLLKHSSRT